MKRKKIFRWAIVAIVCLAIILIMANLYYGLIVSNSTPKENVSIDTDSLNTNTQKENAKF